MTVQVHASIVHYSIPSTFPQNPNFKTSKDFPNKIQVLSRTSNLFKEFPGIENETKSSGNFKDPWEQQL